MTKQHDNGLTIDVLCLAEARELMSGDVSGIAAIVINDDDQQGAANCALRLHERNNGDTKRLVLVEAYR